MPLGAVHQFHSGAAAGDAITNQMLNIQRRLRRAGYFSEIYAEHIADDIREWVRPLAEFNDLPSTLLLVHHSMGHTAFDDVLNLDVPIVTVFHSITPTRFFEDAWMRRFVRLGFVQLRQLARRSLFGIADSNHNRHEMYDAGFRSVDVLPVRTDFHEHRALRDERSAATDDWLFVGRVVPNKRQLELVRAFALYRRTYQSGHLHLVGDVSMDNYVQRVRNEIGALGIESHVTLQGKISQRALYDRYRDAGVFVCLSEHEGFGVPLLEAMAAGVPVIALAEAAVAETMGGAGALITDNDPATVAALARVIDTDVLMRARLIEQQDHRLERIERFDVDGFLDSTILRPENPNTRTTVQIHGPFETSYSLAILNRELALALSEYSDLDVSIYATEGPGDYSPSESNLSAHPRATELYRRSSGVPFPEVAIRQMYPPRVHDSVAGMTFQYFGWEESRLPADIVEDFNRHLDGIGTMSSYVKDLLADSGVVVPMAVVGVGVHAPDPAAMVVAPELVDLRTTRFLHISSAFPRKGVDVLLRAYFQTFSESDDVSLILKTFPNPHNEAASMLEQLRSEFPDAPHVCWIDRDLDRNQLDGLYGLASGYVHPARGEGFGLPVAEAMLAGIPVIAVAATGLRDFVSAETAAVVGHWFAPASTHLTVPGSEWAEPNVDDVGREMRRLADGHDTTERLARVEAARTLIQTEYTWQRVGERWHDFLLTRRTARVGRTVAAVTTYNSRCGIAEYSSHLYEPMGEWAHIEVHADDNVIMLDPEVEDGVRRSWPNHRRGPLDELLASLERSSADIVHIQYNLGFFELSELGRLVRLQAARRAVVVTLHRTSPLRINGQVETLDQIVDDLRLADAVVVHQSDDVDRLAAAGLTANVQLIPIGTEAVVDIDPTGARRRHGVPQHSFVVGTYGFLLPHKGLMRLLGAVAALRARCIDVHLVAACALHPDPSSAHHRDEVAAEIHRLGLEGAVLLVTDYLDAALSRDLLACADVLVLPYEYTNESASAALRSVLTLGRATVTSDLRIFADVLDVVRSVPAPVDPEALADLLEELWLNPEERHRIADAVRQFAHETSWTNIARRTRRLYEDLISSHVDVPLAGDASLATTASDA